MKYDAINNAKYECPDGIPYEDDSCLLPNLTNPEQLCAPYGLVPIPNMGSFLRFKFLYNNLFSGFNIPLFSIIAIFKKIRSYKLLFVGLYKNNITITNVNTFGNGLNIDGISESRDNFILYYYY